MDKSVYTRLLFVDTETGGLDSRKHSLLSVGLAVWDQDDGLIASNEFFLKNDEYATTKAAERINKFDRNMHDEKAIDSKILLSEIKRFALSNFSEGYPITLAGHNIQFDVSFLRALFADNGASFDNFFSHRAVDTHSILRSLVFAGKIQQDISSSAKAFHYFNIKANPRHSALGDILATVELFEKMLALIDR